MALNSNDRKNVVNTASQNGWKMNSDGSGMNKDSQRMTFSSSGGSVNIGGSKYTDASSASKNLKK